MMVIGERIKKRRKDLRMTADQLAEKLGKNRATIYRYENEDIDNMPVSVLAPLAEALKCSPVYLMGIVDELFPIEDSDKLSDQDRRLIEKYRSLDIKGRHTVNTVLDIEYKRCTAEGRKEEPFVIAAHSDDYSEEQIRLMREDLEEL